MLYDAVVAFVALALLVLLTIAAAFLFAFMLVVGGWLWLAQRDAQEG